MRIPTKLKFDLEFNHLQPAKSNWKNQAPKLKKKKTKKKFGKYWELINLRKLWREIIMPYSRGAGPMEWMRLNALNLARDFFFWPGHAHLSPVACRSHASNQSHIKEIRICQSVGPLFLCSDRIVLDVELKNVDSKFYKHYKLIFLYCKGFTHSSVKVLLRRYKISNLYMKKYR